VVVEAGAIPIFVQLLDSPDVEVREQAVWAIGNIAGDSPACRDAVLAAHALPNMLKHLSATSKTAFVRNVAWTISNCLRGKPAPPIEVIRLSLPMLARLLYSEDIETLVDALWALSYFTDSDEGDMLQMTIESGVCARLAVLLKHDSVAVQTPALRTIGNIVTGDEVQTQVIINHGALESLQFVLDSTRKVLKKEACWAVSNVMAGNKEQIQASIDANLVPQLVTILKNGTNKETKREACWALSNTTSGGTPEQILWLIRNAVIPELAAMSRVSDDAKIGARGARARRPPRGRRRCRRAPPFPFSPPLLPPRRAARHRRARGPGEHSAVGRRHGARRAAGRGRAEGGV
jgi:importin subunit alpha-1